MNIILPLTTRKVILKDIIENLKKVFGSFFNLIILCERKNSVIEDFEKLKLDFNQDQLNDSGKSKKKQKEKEPLNSTYNCSIFIFPNGTSEDMMLNASILEMPESEFILIRNDVQTIDYESLNAILIEKEKSNADIIMAKQKKPRNFILKFFDKVFKSIYGFLFNFHLYIGDIGIQYFNQLSHSIMKNVMNPIALTKLNRWIGMDVRYVETTMPKTQLKEKNYGKSRIKFSLLCCLFVLILGISILFNHLYEFSFMLWFTVFFILLIIFSLAILSGFKIYLISKVGEIRTEKIYINEIKSLF